MRYTIKNGFDMNDTYHQKLINKIVVIIMMRIRVKKGMMIVKGEGDLNHHQSLGFTAKHGAMGLNLLQV